MKNLLVVGMLLVLAPCALAKGPALPRVTDGAFAPAETGVYKVTCTPSKVKTEIILPPPAGIETAEAIAFDFYAADFSVYSAFEMRVIAATNVRTVVASPDREGSWNRVVVSKAMLEAKRGPLPDWRAVDCVKFAVRRALPEKADVFYIGNLKAVQPVNSQAKSGERRLGWVTAHAMNGDDDWEATAVFMKKWGFTDMVPLVARGACAYYDSKVVPRAVGLPEGRNAAREAVEACHRHGLKCHLWKTSWQVRNDTQPAFLKQLAAEKRFQVTDAGKVDKGWLCPSDERNRAVEIGVMKEFVALGADAVHFDYNRYQGESHCFCPRCLAAFSKITGRTVASAKEIRADAALARQWADFRAELISSVVREVAAYAHAQTPRVEVSAALYRNPPADYVPYAQDWPRWCREGWLDVACPMDYYWSPGVYSGFIKRQKEFVKGTQTQFCPGLGIACNAWPALPLENLKEQLRLVRENGCEGFTVFHIGKTAAELFPLVFGK